MALPLATELKTHLFRMIAAVVVLDAVAMGLYYWLHIRSATPRIQTLFTGAWTVVTLGVVLTGLGRIRAARVRYRRRLG